LANYQVLTITIKALFRKMKLTIKRIAFFLSSLLLIVVVSSLLFTWTMNSKVVAQTVPPLRTGDTVIVGTTRVTFLATGADTNGKYTVARFFLQPNAGFPAHFHTREDEVFYVSKGKLFFQMEDSIIDAVRGDTIYFYARNNGMAHIFQNLQNKPIELLLTWLPSGIESFFAEIGTPATATTLPPKTLTPEQQAATLAKFLNAGPKYGIMFDRELISAGMPMLKSNVTDLSRTDVKKITKQFADQNEDDGNEDE
jgi:quercetin dioxygenase-like cupin family protein